MFSSRKVLSYLAGLQSWVSSVLLILLFPYMPPSFCFLSFWKSSHKALLSSERQWALKNEKKNPGAQSHSQKHPARITNQTENVCWAGKTNRNQLLLLTRQGGMWSPCHRTHKWLKWCPRAELPPTTRWNSSALPWTFSSTDTSLLLRNKTEMTVAQSPAVK